MKCSFKDENWLVYGQSCKYDAEVIVSLHYLGYPSGQVVTGQPIHLCGKHSLRPISQFLEDDGKKVFGVTYMRYHEDDKINLRARIGQ